MKLNISQSYNELCIDELYDLYERFHGERDYICDGDSQKVIYEYTYTNKFKFVK